MTSFLPVAESVLVSASEYDNVYQSASNTLKSASRVINAQTYQVSLPNMNLNTKQTLDLPTGQLLSTTVLVLKFTKAQIGIANLVLRPQWMYDAIEYVEYAFAGSERLVISGAHMLQKHLADCESGQKRISMMDLNGTPYLSGATAVVPAIDVIGYVNLYLPFSNMSSSRVIPFDASLLSRPVRISIKFASTSSLFCVQFGQTLNPLAPTAFTEAYIMVKTGLLKDEADSIRDLVGPMGSSQYSYGYQYPLAFESSEAVPHYPETGTQKASVRVTGFQNGSIGSIDLWLRLEGYVYGAGVVVATRNSVMNRNLSMKMRNIEILYAGQQIWTSPDEIDLMMALSEYPVNNTFALTTFNNDSNLVTNPPEDISATSVWYHCQLTQFNETFFSNLLQNGINVTNNTIEIRFHTPELSEVFDIAPQWDGVITTVSAPTYKLMANINYQASILLQKGSAQTVFSPPIPVLASTLSF
jgi:hypothetical protein